VNYVEAHGTGTRLGDPIELNALRAVYGTKRDSQVLVGAVKSNIGHLEGAAGLAGLLKTILVLRHESVPANLNLNKINPLYEEKSNGNLYVFILHSSYNSFKHTHIHTHVQALLHFQLKQHVS